MFELTDEIKMDMVVDKLSLKLYSKELRKKVFDADIEGNWFLHCFKLFEKRLIDIAANKISDPDSLTADKILNAFQCVIDELISKYGIQGFFNAISDLGFDRKPSNAAEINGIVNQILKEKLN